MERVAIITSTYTEGEKLKVLLKSLRKQDYKNFQTYWVDDSKGYFYSEIKQKFPEVKCFVNKENEGLSTSVNNLIGEALDDKADYILHLDDDIEITQEDWLSKFIKQAKENNADISTCRILYPNLANQCILKGDGLQFYQTDNNYRDNYEIYSKRKVSDVIGCCMLMKTSMIVKVGLWDEGFSPAFGEDTDYCYRAKKHGYNCYYFGNLYVIHNNHSTTDKLENDFVWYLKKRNAIRLEWKHFPRNKILKYSLIHFASLIKNPTKFFKRLNLLLGAYNYNFDRLDEIKYLRKHNG